MSRSFPVALAVCRRTWVKTLRRPVVLSFSFVQPVMWMLFFGFLFQRYPLVDLPPGTSYLDFLAPGVCAMTVLFGASQSGISWIRDLQTAFLGRMLQTPAGHRSILAGKVAADVLRLLAQALVVLSIAALLGARVRFAPLEALAALACLALFGTAFSCLSCTIALRARAQEAMAVFVHVVNMPILFTSTALVPKKQMPDWLAAISAWNPLTLTVDAWRGALLFGSAPSLGGQVLPLALLGLLFFPLAAAAMRSAARSE